MPNALARWLALAALVAGCSTSTQTTAPSHPPIPPPPPRPPHVIDFHDIDHDGNAIGDELEKQLGFAVARHDQDELAQPVFVEVRLKTPVTERELDAFVAHHGFVRNIYKEIAYGWIGMLPLGEVRGFARDVGPTLRMIHQPRMLKRHMIEASRTGRVRPIWASGFAGNAGGYSGNSNIVVGVVDTGFDYTHTDLASREAGFKDWSSSQRTTAWDDEGHGTAVAGVVAGTGAAFGAGPGTLDLTSTYQSINGSGAIETNIHTPFYFDQTTAFSGSGNLTFTGGGTADWGFGFTSDGSQAFNLKNDKSGSSPISNSYSSGSTAATFAPDPSLPTSGTIYYAATVAINSYPSVGDGFNALRGVAPSSMIYGERVCEDNQCEGFNAALAGSAIDDLINKRKTSNIKIINLSFEGDSIVSGAAVTAAEDGLIVVASAGNGGSTSSMQSLAKTGLVITAGATNDQNALTYYSNVGVSQTATSTQDAIKPDLVAPGGSAYRSMILVPDSNTDDALYSSFPDVVANDYTAMQGTSFSAPFIAGAAALFIDAMQQAGTSWTWTDQTQPMFVKMMLCATATETNANREASAGSNPSLGRAATPKDQYEGYGIINPDAAIEAYTETLSLPWSDTVANSSLTYAKRAWGRNLSLIPGSVVSLSMTVPATGDYDVYLYSPSPDSFGNPVILASSTNAGSGTSESLSYTSTALQTAYLVVKRVSGYGSWTLSGSIDSSKCGNGVLDTGEECDNSAAGYSSSCCSSQCATINSGGSCNDGDACTLGDHCLGGSCVESGHRLCAAEDQCHQVGTCDPSTGVCSNPTQPDGTSCDDGDACTSGDTCQAGTCTGGTATVCTASDQCHQAGTCDSSTGLCSNPTQPNGTSCSDGNACTTGDTCQSGACTAGATTTCTASDQCHQAGSCDPSTGLCSNPTQPDGTSCSDGNGCTTGDVCKSGACTSGVTMTCTASDQCHQAGTCDPSTGKCSNPTQPNGTVCNDNNACTSGETCQSGTCTAATTVTCTASDQCHNAGTCNTTTGVCSTGTVKANGTSCSDGNGCTVGDTCQSGTCVSGTTKTCTASDQCHQAGTCDSSTGSCSNPTVPDGTTCNDNNACTSGETCESGVCTAGTTVTCTAPDQCHNAGTCNTSTGVCSMGMPKPNGTACNDNNACTAGDTCQMGMCRGGSAVVCTASDQCHNAGTCSPSTGCSNPIKPNGTACDDANACTKSDTCQNGTCDGTQVVCTALDQCHQVGTCDQSSGVCTNPEVGDGTACNDGNACTSGETCEAGSCTGGTTTSCTATSECKSGMCDATSGACVQVNQPDGTPCGNGCNASCQSGTCTASGVTCTALDQCHTAGMCDPSTGMCTNPQKPDGTGCDDGDPCTVGDACSGGSCGGTAKTCTALDECHLAGTCDSVLGGCSNPLAPDGTSCQGGAGTCMSGACVVPDLGVTNAADMALADMRLPNDLRTAPDLATGARDLAVGGTGASDLAVAAPPDLGAPDLAGVTPTDLGAPGGAAPPDGAGGSAAAPAGCNCAIAARDGNGAPFAAAALLVIAALLARRRRAPPRR